MALWILRPIDPDRGPWNPWYNRCFGFVVRASDEAGARAETEGETAAEELMYGKNPWLDPALTSCEELCGNGPPGVIIKDVHSA